MTTATERTNRLSYFALLVAFFVTLAAVVSYIQAVETRRAVQANCQALSILHEGYVNAYRRDRATHAPQAQKSAAYFKNQLKRWPKSRCDDL